MSLDETTYEGPERRSEERRSGDDRRLQDEADPNPVRAGRRSGNDRRAPARLRRILNTFHNYRRSRHV